MVHIYYNGRLPKGVVWENPIEVEGITSDGIKAIARECNLRNFSVLRCVEGRFDMFDNNPYVEYNEFPIYDGYIVIMKKSIRQPTSITNKLLSKYITNERRMVT